jgi:hypothetical protein
MLSALATGTFDFRPGGTPHIARTKRCFGTVVHSDHYPPRDDVDEVANLATVGPNGRFDRLRPAPSRLMDHALDLDTTQIHDIDLALVKGSCFFRGIKCVILSVEQDYLSVPKAQRFGVPTKWVLWWAPGN